MPGHSRRHPEIHVHLISNVSRGFIPVSRSAVYRGGSWVRRIGQRVGSWVGAGIKLFGGVAVVTMSTVPAHVWANPTGEVVVGGAASFNRPDAATLIVNQQTDRAVINWNSFSIANGELTRFVQPSSTSAALNRVVTANPSQIYGTLQSNGQLYLINPGGVMVGPGGVVDVAGFVASTHDIANEEFMRGGNLNFHGNSEASILNQGKVEAREGDVFLVAREVKNEGQLMARDGTVGMVSGTEVSLQAVGQGNYKIRLLAAEDDPTTPRTSPSEGGASKGSAEIVNEGVIEAANAVLEAKGSYLPMAIKNTGLIEATGVRENGDGTVSLTGGEGDILNTGVVAALQRSLDGQSESGGSVLMTGKNVTSDPTSIITAAGWDGGGSVRLRAADTTILRGEISVVGGAESAKGGQVQLLGERVGLFDQAKVDASGGAGGGEVLVGGDYLGRNPEVPNAKAMVMGSEAKITADATADGDGGRVILWSDEYTGFYGSISARGGLSGGDGGFVETSSKNNIVVSGLVEAGAFFGKGGTWLIDPQFIEIRTINTVGYPPAATDILWNDGGAAVTTIVDPRSITRALSGNPGSNTSLILQANTSIQVLSAINPVETNGNETYSTSANNSLTLQAGSEIQINASVEIAGAITLISNDPLAISANITPLNPGIQINSSVTSQVRDVTIRSLAPTLLNQVPGDVRITAAVFAGTGRTVSITAENGNIVLSGNISAFRGGNNLLSQVNLTTGSNYIAPAANFDGGFINQTGGVITAATINALTQSSVVPAAGNTTPGEHGLAYQLSSYIYLGSANEANNVSLITLGQNGLPTYNALTYDPTAAAALARTLIYYNDATGFNIGTTTAPQVGGVAATANRGITTAGSVNLVGGPAGNGRTGNITQSQPVQALALGITAVGNVTLDNNIVGNRNNDVLYLAGDTRASPINGDFIFTDRNGFNVNYAQTFWGAGWTGENTLLFGIRAGGVALTAENYTQANGIRLLANEGVFRMRPEYQYTLLSDLPVSFTTTDPRPGHIEARNNVTITVVEPAGGTGAGRFTLDEGIHLFAGMNNSLTQFSGTDPGDAIGRGIVEVVADNMLIGGDTQPTITMNGLIMTGNINQSPAIDEFSGVFLRPYGTQVASQPNYFRSAAIVSPKAQFGTTPNPGELQLTDAELSRINTSRLQVRSAFTSATAPAVDVRSPLSLNGLYDVTTVSGIFPNTAGVNRLELWASGGATGNVQVSADISADANSSPMQIFLSSADALNTGAGTVNVNAGLRSYGGNIAIQGNTVNISGAINANNPNNPNGRGLVAIFPGQATTWNMNLGTKAGALNTLELLRSELALITAGTIQIGISSASPAVLQPASGLTGTFLAGANPLWVLGALGSADPDATTPAITGLNTGVLQVTDLISGLSIDTLALLADDAAATGTAISQLSTAGIQVAGLFIAGAPGTGTVAAPTTEYILNSSLNQIDRLAVALGTTTTQDTTGAGAALGEVFLNNSTGLIGGNSGEVARTGRQWWQGLIRADANTAPLYTGAGLVVARALSITAAGPVAIYETLPAGVTGVGQYMAHVNADPTSATAMNQTEVGNQIGVVGGTGTTVGLAIDARQNTPGEANANTVWAAAARGLAVSDLATVFTTVAGVTGNGGIINNGGSVTLEGNAIEIAPLVVARSGGGGTITIDTTGNGITPAGARVVIRPATGQNGFQNRAGSGAYAFNLQNSPFAGAPVEMNLGTGSTLITVGGLTGTGAVIVPLIDVSTGAITSYRILSGGTGYAALDPVTITANGPGASASATLGVTLGVITSVTAAAPGFGYGGGFLDASFDTIYLQSLSLQGGAVRASVLEIGRNTDPGTASGKLTVTSNIGAGGTMSSLLGEMHLISGGAVEDSGMIVTGGTPNTITMNLNNTPGNGGLAVEALGAIALQGNVSVFAADAGANNNVRFIDTAGGLSIGVVDQVSGILANTFYLQVSDPITPVNGRIGQASGATIQAATGGISLSATGDIRLDQLNDFNLVAADAGGGDIYLRSAGAMTISSFGAGQPGGQPPAVTGVTGGDVTLVSGGDLRQSEVARIQASDSFSAVVQDGSNVYLDSTLNSLGGRPVVAAVKADGTLGSVGNLQLVNPDGVVLGSAGVLDLALIATGSGWTQAPTVTFNAGVAPAGGNLAVASAVMGVGSIAISNGGAGYLAAPVVTITDGGGGGGTGAAAQAVVDLNPLSSTYGQLTSIDITNAGTGYGTAGSVTFSLSGGSPTQVATLASAATLVLQRINMTDPGLGYTTAPTVTLTLPAGASGSGASVTATIGGTGGYASGTTILGGLTGNLYVSTAGSAANGISQPAASGISVQGTTTLLSRNAIDLGALSGNLPINNLQGVLTVGSDREVTIRNANFSILGNFTGVDNTTGLADATPLGGPLVLGSSLGIYQQTASSALGVTGAASFFATSTAQSGGTPSGVVILNNAGNSLTSTVAAEGTRVVIRNSGALDLGAVTASTSLVATSGSAGITQSGVINSTGAASFAAAANQSIILGDLSNVFGSTVSFSALTGQLQNVTVTDSTALDLQALNILGDLTATGAGLTQSGILQAADADLSSTGSGNSLNLSTFNNVFTGEVRIRSDGDATLFDNGPLIIGNGGASIVAGNLTLSSAGAFSQTQAITVNGTGNSSISTTVGGVTFSQNITLANGNLTVAPGSTFTQSGGTLSLGTGTLAISSTGLVQQTGGNMVVAGTATVNSGGAAITLTSFTNDFQEAVTLTGGVTQIRDGVGGLTLGTLSTGNLTATSTGAGGVLNLGQGSVAGTFSATANNGNITQNGILTVTGLTTLTAGTGNIVLGSANSLANVTVNSATDVTLRNTALTAGTLLYPNLPAALQNLTLIFDNSAATLSANPLNLTGSLSITAGGGAISSVNPISVSGATILSAGSSAITFNNAANDFIGTVTIGGTGLVTMQDANNLTLAGQQSLNLGNITTGATFTVSSPGNITSATGTEINTGGTLTLTAGNNADVRVNQNDNGFIGSVNVAGTFTLRTDPAVGFTLGGVGGFGLGANQLSNFRVGTFAPVANGADITIPTAFNYGGIQNLSLTTLTSGNILADGAVSNGMLSLSSAGTATFNAVNSISSLGSVSIGAPGAGLTFQNNRGLSLSGAASMQGRLSLEVAGQFYNQTGSATPLAGVQGGSVVKSLSLAGGLPNLISGLAGFGVRYDGVMPTSGNVMSYAVSPLTMFAPNGTVIAGVNLSGTQTGGGQLNTFFTGSDNLNWMIADFGKFNLPKVEPARMEYMLYQQRVEPETRSLPQPVMRELTMELGRPPTVEELQAREVARRQAVQMRSGAILERSSFDEDVPETKQEAMGPGPILDGGKPQAGVNSESEKRKAETGSTGSDPKTVQGNQLGTDPARGLTPSAKKQTDTKRDANGPMLRNGPQRAVALLRPAASGEDAGASQGSPKVSIHQILQDEKERAEVNVAPPVAGAR